MKHLSKNLEPFWQNMSAIRVLMCLLLFAWGTVAWAAVDYQIYIGGVPVTDDNKDDIPCPYIKSGTISYDSDNFELTLDNVQVEAEADVEKFIQAEKGNLSKISLVGKNTITMNGGTAISAILNQRLGAKTEGSYASLKINGAETGIYVRGSLTIEECSLQVSGSKYGIHGGLFNLPMYINFADVLVIGEEKPIYGFWDVIYDRSYLLFPMNATYNNSSSETCCFVVPGTTTPYSGVFYFERCHVMIGGELVYPNTPITTGVKAGSVSYDFSTRTLTLNNAIIETSNEVPILFMWQTDQTINLIGNNTITTNAAQAIAVENSGYYKFYNGETGVVPGRLTVKGDGTLTIDAEEASAFSLAASKLYVENTTVDIVSKYGLFGNECVLYVLLSVINNKPYYLGNNIYETLTLENCYFSYHNPEDYEDGTPLYYLDGLNLINAKFDSPTGAYYDSGFLLWDGGLANTMVVVPDGSPTAIAPGISEREDAQPWYNLSGQRIAKPTKPGIYIHGKKKMIVD